VPFDKWFRELSQSGYAGTYEFELHGAGVADKDYQERLTSICSFVDEDQRSLNTLQQASLNRPRINRDR
jgi:hypothetical protein